MALDIVTSFLSNFPRLRIGPAKRTCPPPPSYPQSRLLLLPAELRYMIYEEVLTAHYGEHWWHDRFAHAYPPCYGWYQFYSECRGLRLLEVCRQIYDEALPILYKTTKIILSTSDAELDSDFEGLYLPPLALQWLQWNPLKTRHIRTLRIDFSMFLIRETQRMRDEARQIALQNDTPDLELSPSAVRGLGSYYADYLRRTFDFLADQITGLRDLDLVFPGEVMGPPEWRDPPPGAGFFGDYLDVFRDALVSIRNIKTLVIRNATHLGEVEDIARAMNVRECMIVCSEYALTGERRVEWMRDAGPRFHNGAKWHDYAASFKHNGDMEYDQRFSLVKRMVFWAPRPRLELIDHEWVYIEP